MNVIPLLKDLKNNIALIGFKGFVGSAIYNRLKKLNLNVIGIDRYNYYDYIKDEFEIIINSAMPSKRFWAKNNPQLDYIETVIKTKDILEKWNFKKIIQISSISARCQKDTVYGKNKKVSEDFCLKFDNHLIIRLGPMYSPFLTKGVLIDIKKNQNVFCNPKSKYSFTNLDFISEWITSNLDMKGLVELGSQDYLFLDDLRKKVNSKSVFDGPIDNQLIESKLNYNQKSIDVIKFLKEIKL